MPSDTSTATCNLTNNLETTGEASFFSPSLSQSSSTFKSAKNLNQQTVVLDMQKKTVKKEEHPGFEKRG